MQIANIIVDVPTMQTNSPYSYLVPKDLQSSLSKGMRVVVPFGKGNRKIEGFVVGIEPLTNQDPAKLKEISSIMDFEPVLDEELLDLSKWLADKTYAFRISCLLTMLPNVMKAKYAKAVKKNHPLTNQALNQKVSDNLMTPFDDKHFTEKELNQLILMQKKGDVEIEYVVKNEAKSKVELAIQNQINDFSGVRKHLKTNASAQHHLLDFLEKHPKEKLVQKKIIEKDGISPSAIKAFFNKGWINKTQVEKYRNPYKHELVRDHPKRLTPEQEKAVLEIDQAIKKKKPETFLIEGVTGSGKTEIYLQNIQTALNDGRQALMLVPEIALTPQMVNRVKNRFGNQVAIIHSGLSNGERYDEWRRIRDGNAKVVVGARSAVFAPLQNIGIIILDEEHDTSYKQDENPRYHTRDVAIWRSKYHHCPVVLGSATPSLESRARAGKGVYHFIRLTKRVNQQQLPEVEIVDMTKEVAKSGDIFSEELLQAINEKLTKHEQVVLMLNRRGFSSFMMCRDCGYVLMCPNCDISLTMHLDSHTMKCHYCGFEEPIPNVCPKCHSHSIRYFGTGTEKVEQELAKILPQARILRMDVDTTKRKGAHERILNEFGEQKADILLGTQMIAKGLDFPNVTLVGALNADTGLDLPDFRASERTFDLLTQVAGRAGRADKAGKVIIQTFNPEHYAIQLVKKQDYETFYKKEMKLRHLAGYAPYYFTVKLTVSSTKEQQAAGKSYEILKYLKTQLSHKTMILGPTPRPIARIKNRYYYQIIIKYKVDKKLSPALKQILQSSQQEARKGLRIAIDSEPVNFM